MMQMTRVVQSPLMNTFGRNQCGGEWMKKSWTASVQAFPAPFLQLG